MSLSAKTYNRNPAALRNLCIIQDAEAEIRHFSNGETGAPYWELSQQEADEIEINRQRWSHEALMMYLRSRGKSRGARYIAARIRSGADPDLERLTQHWFAHRNIKQELTPAELVEIDASPRNLRELGISYRWQARCFYELYRQVMNPRRSWGSSKQVNQSVVLAIATTPEYDPLPLWVKKVLIESGQKIERERVGNIWRLIPCAKAWKHAPMLPKGLAEKVGKLSLRYRLLSGWAWERATGNCRVEWCHSRNWRGYVSRQELVNNFWTELQRLASLDLPTLIQERIDEGWRGRVCLQDHNTLRVLAELSLRLPSKSLFEAWGLHRHACYEKYMSVIAAHATHSAVPGLENDE